MKIKVGELTLNQLVEIKNNHSDMVYIQNHKGTLVGFRLGNKEFLLSNEIEFRNKEVLENE